MTPHYDAFEHRRSELRAHTARELARRREGPGTRAALAVVHLPDSASERQQPPQPAPRVVGPASASVEDEELVARAVIRVREILGQTMQRGIEEVGQYLFREFYHSSPALYQSTHPNKHVSLQSLMDRTDSVELPVTKVFLARAIKMAVLQAQLPKQSHFMLLPPSHRLELLRIRCPERLDQLATRAYETNISVQKLRDLVRREIARSKSTRGRKPVPEIIKSLRICVRQVRDDDPARLTFLRQEINGFDRKQLAEAQNLVSKLMRRVDQILRMLP